MSSPLKANDNKDTTQQNRFGKKNTNIHSQFRLRDSKIEQNNFEFESQSNDSQEEIEQRQQFAQTQFELKINGDKEMNDKEMDEFINIYKSKFGMPASQGNETYVKDYLFKLLEFKQHNHDSQDESSCDEHEQVGAKNESISVQNEETQLKSDQAKGA